MIGGIRIYVFTYMSNYWNQNTDEAIQQFLVETDMDKREEIFNSHIYNPLTIISEVFVSKYGGKLDRQDAIQECISFLYTRLFKIDYTKTVSGYSYITRCCMHYIMQQNIKQMKFNNTHYSIDAPLKDEDDNGNTILDRDMPVEHNNSNIPVDFDFEAFRKLIIENIGEAELRQVLKKFKLDSRGSILNSYIRALSHLGSKKFHIKKKQFKIGSMVEEYLTHLAPLAKKLAKLD